MRISKYQQLIYFCIFILIILIFSSDCIAWYYCVEEEIEVADTQGNVQNILQIPHKESRKIGMIHTDSKQQRACCLRVVRNEKPFALSWIHLTQILTAQFQKTKSGVLVNLQLENGTQLRGRLFDEKMSIAGRTDLGTVTYKIKDVRSIKFLRFLCESDNGYIGLSREAASKEWRTRREKPSMWTVTFGERKTRAYGLTIRDTFKTNKLGWSVTVIGDSWDGWEEYTKLPIKVGLSQLDMDLEQVNSIDLTGRTVENLPEIKVQTVGGKDITGQLMMMTFRGYRSKEKEDVREYGNFDTLDMLVYETIWGYGGISLSPNRSIVMVQQRQ